MQVEELQDLINNWFNKKKNLANTLFYGLILKNWRIELYLDWYLIFNFFDKSRN